MKMNRNTQLIKGLTNTMPVDINLLTIRDYYLLCKLILLALLLCHKTGHCQRMATESNNNNNASATTTTTTTTETTTTIVTSTPSSLDPAENVTSELILSAEEFVDSREVPLIVIDGTTNEDPPVATTSTSTTSTPRPTTTTATSSENSTQASSNISPPPSATVSSDSSHRPTSTTTTPRTPLDNLSSPAAVTTTTLPTTTIATTTPATTSPKLNESSGDPVLDHDEAVGDNGETTDETDDDTSDNGGQMLPNESDRGSFEPPQNISQYMDYIEKLFHDLRHQITHLFEPHLPQLIRTSQMVELTSSCSYDMLRMALALRQFEPWALRMIDSSGKVPEGIFEGSFTALGSYDECLGTIFDPGSSASESASSDQATTANGKQAVSGPTRGKYCLVTVSPFMPPKPPADKVELLFQEEANRRNYTRDDQFARLSPMFYYMKFRIGVCMPSTCDQSDMDSISGALSSSLRLNITIPDCRVQQPNQQLTRHQLIGGLTFALVSACVLLATLIDCFKLKWKQLECQDIEFIQEANTKEAATTNGHNNKTGQQKPQLVLTGSGKLIGNADHQQQRAPAATIVALENRLSHEAIKIKIAEQPQLAFRLIGSAKGSCGGDNVKCKTCCNAAGEQHLIERLRKHWTWMSFSLIANFRLYFQPETLGQPSGNSSTAPCKSSSVSTTNSDQFRQPTTTTTTIACLNGIRVLSLCWVIVANSYLTLDPRATKRLTKTREAPRDFLFQLVVQASLAIETFFFLSGLLMSLSFSKRLRPSSWTRKNSSSRETTTTVELNTSAGDGSQRRLKYLLKWIQFYVHRYVRMTPPTMLVIAFSMFAYHYGDGPLWFEATQRVHQSCTQNWWRHLLHVANFIDTRQMCFIHYWYIAADMQLFLFAPILLFLLFKFKYLGYLLIAAIGGASMASVFHTTYTRSLPPTLLFYSTDPESRREFGNTIMTKPMTHAMPYLVGMLVGWWCVVSSPSAQVDQHAQSNKAATKPGGMDRNSGGARIASSYPALSNNGLMPPPMKGQPSIKRPHGCHLPSVTGILGWLALAVALTELFLPYMWNNSHLPGPLVASIYAALFRFGWSLVLAYVVLSCRHRPGKNCQLPAAAVGSDGAANLALRNAARVPSCCKDNRCCCRIRSGQDSGESVHHRSDHGDDAGCGANEATKTSNAKTQTSANAPSSELSSLRHCYCGSGGNYLNRLLSLSIFSHLSKLSFVAYLIHLPLMSVFIGQTRGLFAFSHTLVIHFAISYLVISFALSFLLVHFIEFPFITFERLLFDWLFRYIIKHDNDTGLSKRNKRPMPNTLEAIRAHEKGHLSYEDPRIRSMTTRLENRQHQQQQHQHHHSLYPPSGLRTNLHPATNQLHRATTTSANQNHITTERL